MAQSNSNGVVDGEQRLPVGLSRFQPLSGSFPAFCQHNERLNVKGALNGMVSVILSVYQPPGTGTWCT
jgi:hypothetical protein